MSSWSSSPQGVSMRSAEENGARVCVCPHPTPIDDSTLFPQNQSPFWYSLFSHFREQPEKLRASIYRPSPIHPPVHLLSIYSTLRSLVHSSSISVTFPALTHNTRHPRLTEEMESGSRLQSVVFWLLAKHGEGNSGEQLLTPRPGS